LNIFLAKVYIEVGFRAPNAHTAAKNDLNLLQQLHAYLNRNIGTATSRKFTGHLWYLSEDLILLSLFDPDVDAPTKRAMLLASTNNEGGDSVGSSNRSVVDLAHVQQKTLADFMTKRCRDIFSKLGVPARQLPQCRP
jgi:hypothetical protein